MAEEPTLGRAIQAAIPEHSDGTLTPAGEYRVVSARGHLLQLKPPEEYDEKYQKWTIEDLPIAFPNWATVPKHGRDERDSADIQRRLKAIKDGLAWADCVLHAGDPDDEGQLLIDEILEYFHNKKPVKRLLVNDMSASYILKQMKHLDDNSVYYPLGRGACARGIADAMFGYNYTRYFSIMHDSSTPLSVGRVQTPTLGLVVNRDRQIDGFAKTLYYVGSITATETSKKANVPVTLEPAKDSDILTDGKILDEHGYDEIIKKINGKVFAGTVTRKEAMDAPPLPLNLAALQALCGTTYKLSPAQTLDLTQSLRMKNMITYNRSSLRYLHESQHAEAPEVAKAVFDNLGTTFPIDLSIKSAAFDDKPLDKQPHHAIIPTATHCSISKCTADEVKVYKAICLYYLIQFMPQKKSIKTALELALPDGWKAKGSSAVVFDPGFSAYLGKGAITPKEDYTPLDLLPTGAGQFTLSDPKIEGKETKPPKRYTQATLIMDMTSIAKYVKDPTVKKLLLAKDSEKKDEHGSIGTPATRSGIVEKLLQRGYIEEVSDGKKPYLKSTELGRTFYDMLPEDIKGVDVTTDWWLITRDIQEEKAPVNALYDAVLLNIKEFLKHPPKLTKVATVSSAREVIGTCPRCGRDIVVGKKGYGCVGWEDKEHPCHFTIWMDHPLLAASKKTVTKTMAKSLLTKGFCEVKGLVSKAGRKYNGVFLLEDSGERVNLKLDIPERTVEIEEDADVVGKCPRCGRQVVDSPSGYVCAGYTDEEAPCKFIIWKKNALLEKSHKTLTADMAAALLEDGKCEINNLTSKTGSKYDAIFVLNDDGSRVRLDLDFPERKDGGERKSSVSSSTRKTASKSSRAKTKSTTRRKRA